MDIIGPILKPALTFVLTKAFQKVRRLQSSYRAAFSNDPVEARIVELAVDDIKAIFGRAGFLNERLDGLLDEIARSGLLDQLCIVALTGENIARARLLFLIQASNHYSKSSAKPPDLDSLFDQFIRIIHTSAEKIHIDVDALRKDLSTKRKLQAAGILRGNGEFQTLQFGSGRRTEITELYKKLPWLSTTSLDCSKFICAVSSATLTDFADITVEGPSNRQMRLPHDKVYVEPNLSRSSAKGIGDEQLYNSGDHDTLAALLHDYSQIVILGDPGGGKTTLARILCHRIGTASKEAGDVLPIFITVRHFEASLNITPQLSLLEFVKNEVARQTNHQISNLSDPLQYALLFGRCIIVFDGLDEIINISKRRQFVSAVLQFMDNYPLNRYVITSRKVGYDEAPLRDPPTFLLSAFGDKEIRQYAKLSATNVFSVPSGSVQFEVERFIQESNKNAKEFLGSPLLLSLILWLFFSTQRIPDGRLNIYRECAELMFQRWDALRNIHPDVPSPFRLFSLLVYLSKSFYLDPALQAGASRVWLRGAVKEFFEVDLSENAAERALEAATKFTDHLVGRAWVLHEVGADRFEFTHRTFLEYFFAKYLSEQFETVDDLFDEIAPHILKSEWVLPVHLALQLKIDGSPSRAGRASDRLRVLGAGRSKKGATAFVRNKDGIIPFIAEATRYLQPNERRLEEIAELVTLRGTSVRHGVSLVFNVLRNPNEMRDAVYRGIASGMGKLYEEEQFERFGIAADWVKANRFANEFAAGHVKYFPGAIGGATDYIAAAVTKHMTGARHGDLGQQKLLFDLTGDYSESFSVRPSVQVWAQSCAKPFKRFDWRFIDAVWTMKEIRDQVSKRDQLKGSFISFSASIFDSLGEGKPASVGGRQTVLTNVEPALLSFIASTCFENADCRNAALAALLVAREAAMDHSGYEAVDSDYRGMEQLNSDFVAAIRKFVRLNQRLLSSPTKSMIEGYIEGPNRIFREEFQDSPKTPQHLLGWESGGFKLGSVKPLS